MAYADPATIQATDPGDPLSAAWCDQVRDNGEFFIDPPACSISDMTGSSVPTATPTLLGGASTETFDNDSMHSTSSSQSRITVQTPGRYLFMSTVTYASHAGADDSFLRVSLRVNGTTSYGGMQIKGQTAASQAVRIQATRALVLAAGDYVETLVQHTLGGTVNPVTLDEMFCMFLTR